MGDQRNWKICPECRCEHLATYGEFCEDHKKLYPGESPLHAQFGSKINHPELKHRAIKAKRRRDDKTTT